MPVTHQQIKDLWKDNDWDMSELQGKTIKEAIELAKTKETKKKERTLNEFQLRELKIIKQAMVKSFVESGKIEEYTEEVEDKIINPWIKFIYRNTTKDVELIEKDEAPF